MKTKHKRVLVPSSWLGPGQCKQGSAAVVPPVAHNNCVQATKNELHRSNPQIRRLFDFQIFVVPPGIYLNGKIILPVRDESGWILKHDILAAGPCRVPTDLNLETHIKLWRMCSDLNSAREEFSETENFWSSRPWLRWQICKLIRICRFWRIDQYFEGLEGLIRIALHQIGCKVHIGWEVLDGVPKSLLVRKWILSSPLNFFSFLGYVRISLLVFRAEKVDDFAFSEFIPSIHILLALVRSFPSTEIWIIGIRLHCTSVLCSVRRPCFFYGPVVTTIRRRGRYRGIFGEEGVDTRAYLGGNHGFRVHQISKV